MNWWIIEFIISALVFFGLAPTLGAKLYKRPHFDFILGFSITYFTASFLIVFHKLGLIILILALTYFFIKKPYFMRFHITDLIVLAPLVYCVWMLPVTIDSNFREYQFAIDHNLWPLDFRNRLDVHFGMAGLFYYWLPETPIMNSLAVQVPFLGFLCWRILVLCLNILWQERFTLLNWAYLITLYFGSLFYRRQIYGKASPIGATFVFLICVLLGHTKENKLPAYVWGWLLACPLLFGEYGFILIIPLILLVFILSHPSKKIIQESSAYALLFMAPEILRKIYISTTNHLPITTAIDANFFNIYQWSIGRGGILLCAVVYLFWKNKKQSQWTPIILFFAVQLIIYGCLQIVHTTGFIKIFNPNMIWWNLYKNAMMISFPLLTTVVGGYFFFEVFQKHSKLKYVPLIFFVFLQDPFVRNHVDGPLSPSAPRLSALQSLREMFWVAKRNEAVFSTSKNLVLWPPLSLHKPDLIEKIKKQQRASSEPILVCIDSKLKPSNVADFDFTTYTVEFATGAIATLLPNKNCQFKIEP